MQIANLTPEQQRKFKNFIREGMEVLEEITFKREGLKEVTKDLAEQLDIKAAVLTKALNTKFKDSLAEDKDKLDVIEDLLNIVD